MGIPSHIPTAAEAPLFDEDEEDDEPKIWVATIVRKKKARPRKEIKRTSRANTMRSGSSDTMSVVSPLHIPATKVLSCCNTSRQKPALA